MDRSGSDTRHAIISAFNRLVLTTRRARPPVTHLLREAGIARSTLYSHFDDRDSLLLEAIRGPLSIVAAAITGDADEQRLVGLLDHFWDQRQEAANLLDGKFGSRLVRSLAEMIMVRNASIERNDAMRIADGQIGIIRLWITGETPGPSPMLARRMITSAAAQRAAWR